MSDLKLRIGFPLAQLTVENKIRKHKSDLVFLDTSILGIFRKSFFTKHRTICFFHNIETLYYLQKTASLSTATSGAKYLTKLRLRIIQQMVRRREKTIAESSTVIITINERDSANLKRLFGRSADFVLHSSMPDNFARLSENTTQPDNDTTAYSPNPESEQRKKDRYILFVGTDFFGNTDGLFSFIENCMKDINCKLIAAGTGMAKYNNRYDSSYKTEFRGFCKNLNPLYDNAVAVVLPIISGSGMKTKTCEALMYGKTIFGTTEAFEGYSDLNPKDCILCNTWQEFTSSINEFLEHPHCFSEINRKTFLEHYSDNAAAQSFFRFLDKTF